MFMCIFKALNDLHSLSWLEKWILLYAKTPFSQHKHDFMAKIGQGTIIQFTGHWKLKFWKNFMYFFPYFNHFSLSIDHLSTFKGQKRIQHTKSQRKSVHPFKIINKIVKTGPKTVKKNGQKQSKTKKLWLSVGYCCSIHRTEFWKDLCSIVG